ncbi:MAG: hypothetical protein M0C28_31910 [Candidatus Moduliflexus flocculans]|nr:hypothetical protein [Candidatus Moduliflexus flocculans]
MNAEGGDDIMVGSGGPGDKYLGASGFDWATFKDDTIRRRHRPRHPRPQRRARYPSRPASWPASRRWKACPDRPSATS